MERKIEKLGKMLFVGILLFPIVLSVIFSHSVSAADKPLRLAFKPQPTKVLDQGELVVSTTNPEELELQVTPSTGFSLTQESVNSESVTYHYQANKVGEYVIAAVQSGEKEETEKVTVSITQATVQNSSSHETTGAKASTNPEIKNSQAQDSSVTRDTTADILKNTTESSSSLPIKKANDTGIVRGAVVRPLPTSDEDKLSNLWYYNAYLTGQHSANMADTEGAIAVKGDSVFPDDLQTFTYGASFREINTTIGDPIREDQFVNVLIGGKIDNRATSEWVKPVVENRTTNGKTQGWLVGRLSMNDWIYKNLGEWFSAVAYKTSDNVIDGAFSSLQMQQDQLTEKLDQLTNNLGAKVYQGSGIQLIESARDSRVLILKMDQATDPLEIKTLAIPAAYLQGDRYKQIIVTSSATKIIMNGTSIAGAFQQESGTYRELASKVSFYLPNAQSITNYLEDDGSYPDTSLPGITNSGADNYGKDNGKNYYHSFTIGSIIAPKATVVYHSGSINGYVFVKNLHQRDGMEIHNFYNPWLPEIEQEKQGEVLLQKEDSQNHTVLAGAEFGIRKKGATNFIAVKETNAQGNLTFSDLAYGDYEIIETKAPAGYALSTTIHSVVISEEKPTIHLTLENRKKTVARVKIQVHKVDADTHEALAGAVFGLRGLREHEFFKAETNTKGNAEFENLIPGYYELVELTSPSGYQVDRHPQIIYVGENQKKAVIEVSNKVQEIKKGSIQLTKIDSLTGEPLAGVKFGVREFGQRDFISKETDHNGNVKFTDLNAGAFYTVAELHSLPGYELTPHPLVIHVNEDGQMVNLGKWSNKKTTIKKGSLKILKSDQESGQPLQGAVFGVRALGQKEYMEQKTNSNGEAYFNELAQGIYEVRELQAPSGYNATNLVKKVSVGYDKETNVTVEKWTNHKTPLQLGSGKIIKTDENGVPLAGAEFAIRNEHQRDFNQHTKTNEQGEAYFDNLPFGKYDVIETKAPDGYQADGKLYHLFVSDKETDEQTITIINQKKGSSTGQVALEKRDEDTKEVMSGVVFALEKSDGTLLNTYKTDKNGRIFVKDLAFGRYQFVEKKTLPGYELDSTPLAFVITHENEAQVLFLQMSNKKEPTTESTTESPTESTTEPTIESSTTATDTTKTPISTTTTTSNSSNKNRYPHTGDQPNWYLRISGLGMIVAVAYLFYRKRR